MRRRAHRILLASFLALYAGISLGGAGLHALPGFGHDPASLSSELPKAPGHPAGSHDRAADDCPFCHFHAQGQLVADPWGAWLVDVLRIRPADDPPLVFPPALDRPSAPRAPPLA
ncbi:DUF2946 family protein [Aquisphaera insulae]|uniref:DUF2946 family protein n=1 Tax=Aquisphaera insulae TaxID=2712864 RepID=UPI0013EB2120|nr:DUF2946 family protein [Aquisphaera insulae]